MLATMTQTQLEAIEARGVVGHLVFVVAVVQIGGDRRRTEVDRAVTLHRDEDGDPAGVDRQASDRGCVVHDVGRRVLGARNHTTVVTVDEDVVLVDGVRAGGRGEDFELDTGTEGDAVVVLVAAKEPDLTVGPHTGRTVVRLGRAAEIACTGCVDAASAEHGVHVTTKAQLDAIGRGACRAEHARRAKGRGAVEDFFHCLSLSNPK